MSDTGNRTPSDTGADSVAAWKRIERELRAALREIRFGSLEIVIHDARIVQIERRQKLRSPITWSVSTGPPARVPQITKEPPMRTVRKLSAVWLALALYASLPVVSQPPQAPPEIEAEQAAEKAQTASSVVATNKDGFQIKSADGNFVLKLRGYIQMDGQFFLGDQPAGVDTFVLRRVRPVLEGTIYKVVDFKIMPDFGLGTTVLQDAYVDVRLAPSFKIRAGKFKEPVGLERLRSATAMTFSLRALPTTLVPNRDLGVQIFGDLFANQQLEYALGVFNGVPDGGSADLDSNRGKELAGRLFWKPFDAGNTKLNGFGIGVGGSYGKQTGTNTAPGPAPYKTTATLFAYRSDGTAAGTTTAQGNRTRISPQGYYFHGPLGVLAEYASSTAEVRRGVVEADLTNTAWQVAGSWVIGGENGFGGVKVKREFTDFGSGPGALEIAARYHEAHYDSDSFPLFANPATAIENARAWGLGLNWWANRGLRTLLSYEEVHFSGAAAASGDRPTERVIFTRVQASF